MKTFSIEKLKRLFRSMLLIRNTELKIESLYHLDEMKTPVHLALGQEAVSVGVCEQLSVNDKIFSNHRSHGHYLAKGGDINAMIAEFYCKETGCSKGRGGSMHLIDTKVGHLGSSAIVAGGIPHAVGSAFGAKMMGKDFLSVAFFGDGAVEEGVLYESMNWAAFKELPVLFVCENNFYAVCSHLSARQKDRDLSIRSRSFGIPSARVDGMDIFDVYEKTETALNHLRAGKGPYFLSCDVQRWRGHAGSGDSIKEKYRMKEDLKEDWEVDPLDVLLEKLSDAGVNRYELDKIDEAVNVQIEAAFKFAQESPLPDVADLEKYLFVE